MLAILVICIKGKKFSTRRSSMWIHISGMHIDDLGTLSPGIGPVWHDRHSGQMWRWPLSRLFAWVGWRCTCSIASPVYLRILCSATVARKASVCVVLMKHSRVSFYCSLHHLMPRKLDTLLLPVSDFGERFLDQILRFLRCSTLKPTIRHFGHSQGKAHVGLFELCPTSLPSHSCRYVENLQEMSCCPNNEIWLVPWPYMLT